MKPRRLAAALAAAAAAFACTSAPTAAPAPLELEVLAQLPGAPGNITVTPNGLVVVSVHPSFDSDVVALAAIGAGVRPFPDGAWSQVVTQGEGGAGLMRVLSVRADPAGRVWMLAGEPGTDPKTFYVWDVGAGEMSTVIEVPVGDAALESSFFNDMALALDHGAVVVSDPAAGGPALVVINLETGRARRVLENHLSVVAEDVDAVIDGRPIAAGRNAAGELVPLRGAVNPITIDGASEWVYYGPMSGRSVYRVRLGDLLDESLSADDLAARVERYGDKPPSAGITIDEAGNVYVTDVGARGVGVVEPSGAYRLIVQDDELLDWPDGLAVDSEGYIYVAANGLYRTWASHADMGRPEAPFPLLRFKALAPTAQGR